MRIRYIVVFTGAGVSRESGLPTFRDVDGLWIKYPIEEVATIDALVRNTEKVLEFYNIRRRKILEAKPNAAHYAIASLEKKYNTVVITQNIDNLHERAGSTKVIHLHGLITQNKCMCPTPHYYDIDITDDRTIDLRLGDKCEGGSQLRHNVVLFGEAVENMEIAYSEVQKADIFIVVGTSLKVYPAANLVYYTRPDAYCFCIDPDESLNLPANFCHIKSRAVKGVPWIVNFLLENPQEISSIMKEGKIVLE